MMYVISTERYIFWVILNIDALIKLPTQEKTSNCSQCLKPGSGCQSTSQGVYKQHRNLQTAGIK
jgi:hypothetical protein